MATISVVAPGQPNSAASNPNSPAPSGNINGLEVTKLNFDRPKDWKTFIRDQIDVHQKKIAETWDLNFILYIEIIANAALVILVGQGALVMSLLMLGTVVILAGRSREKRETMLKIAQLRVLAYKVNTPQFHDRLKTTQARFGRAFTTDHLNYMIKTLSI